MRDTKIKRDNIYVGSVKFGGMIYLLTPIVIIRAKFSSTRQSEAKDLWGIKTRKMHHSPRG